MSLFSTLRTSVSGMAAQSNALSAIGDNIANASTVGYKEASAQFETMLGENATSTYESGGVNTTIRYGITDQGTLESTSSATDMAVNGNGFFVVSQAGQGQYLTRAGSFVPDSNGNLVNAAGYQLMAYPVTSAGVGSTLTPVTIAPTALQYSASTSGTLTANLPSTATAVTDPTMLPSTDAANAQYTDKTSLTVYDNQGNADVYDVYMTKKGDNNWEVAAYPQADAAAGGGFPYTAGGVPGGTPDTPATANLVFTSTGTLDTSKADGGNSSLTLKPSNGNATGVTIDLSGMTQVASDFGVTTAKADGNAPSKFDHVKIGTDGTLTEVYANGTQIQAYKIPLATVASPDNLTPLSGNVYEVSQNSGNIILSTAGTNGTGTIAENELEQSTVDLASELTNMIVAQRGYEANSKVLQASSDLLGTLNRITTN